MISIEKCQVKGFFSNVSAISIIGNDKLCGGQIKLLINVLVLKREKEKEEKNKK
jgi:hypothetical protein